ncbi:MAG: redoxin domain-containing protein [Thermomicrobiales bacterium]|jgi:peroxiredoxin|nr:redoxin domain-containing protein [Thermomicrobiales bacterium]
MTNPIAPLSAGTTAPDFTLKASSDREITLGGLRGKPVILAFYPADWSPTCSDQMALYQQVLPEFERFGAQLLGISVDSVWCHKAFAADRGLTFPILADFHPHGAVSDLYGTFNAESGMAARSLFVLDKDGVIAWSYLAPPGVNPGADGILAALEALPDS